MGDGEERGRDAAPADRNASPAGRLFLGTLFLLAGCTRLILAVLLVYGSPLELYWSSNGTPSKFTPQNGGGLLLGQSVAPPPPAGRKPAAPVAFYPPGPSPYARA